MKKVINNMEFQEITYPYMKELHAVAVRLTKNQDEAEDLIQDTYIKAFRFFHRFQKGTNAKAWLFKIMIRLFYTRYRQKKIELVRTDIADQTDFISSEADPENVYLEKLVDKEILDAIDKLSEQFRTVLLLADVEELSYYEISQILKIPIGTIMSRLHRARKKLANDLHSYAIEKGLISSSKN